MTNKIEVFQGNTFIDDRGVVSFINELNLKIWKRFYLVENHYPNYIRAWHGHKLESKLVIPVRGVTQVSAVEIDNWDNPSRSQATQSYFLSSSKPSAILIPGGYANGFKSLTADSKLIIFSSSTLDESTKDDYRFDWNYWNCWEENFR